MRKITGTEMTAIEIIAAIREIDPNLVTPVGWPAQIEAEGSFENSSIVKMSVLLPDLNLRGEITAAISFLLKREQVKGVAGKFIYEPSMICVSKMGESFISSVLCKLVRNTVCYGDDFVVPMETRRDDEILLMEMSTKERRQWLRQHRFEVTIESKNS